MSELGAVVISFVSGKGGVGKTMLAVAFAREISVGRRTLLLDLDFFNRGLTGLLRHGKKLMSLEAPAFLKATPPTQRDVDSWQLKEVAPNLLHVQYPDLTPDEIRSLEEADISELSEGLRRYVEYLRSASACDVIVMDCHGGPDQLSFAACLISDHSLLISEPDKITFYGTLHFVRQMERIRPQTAQKPDMRLIFNKVVPAFSAPYLTRFYDSEVRPYFDDRPLLAIFPIEIYLTKEFERTPFLTAAYPYSQLARKTRMLISDLLAKSRSELVPPAILATSSLRRKIIRYSLGRTPAIIELNHVLAVIAIVSLLTLGFNFYGDKEAQAARQELLFDLQTLGAYEYVQKYPTDVPDECKSIKDIHTVQFCLSRNGRNFWPVNVNELPGDQMLKNSSDPEVSSLYQRALELNENQTWFSSRIAAFLEKYGGLLGAGALVWFLSALLLNWSMFLDRAFTYQSRSHHRIAQAGIFLTGIAMWLLPMLAVGILAVNFSAAKENAAALCLSLIPLGWILAEQSSKAYQNLRFDKLPGEGAARLLFVLYIVAVGVIGSFVSS